MEDPFRLEKPPSPGTVGTGNGGLLFEADQPPMVALRVSMIAW